MSIFKRRILWTMQAQKVFENRCRIVGAVKVWIEQLHENLMILVWKHIKLVSLFPFKILLNFRLRTPYQKITTTLIFFIQNSRFSCCTRKTLIASAFLISVENWPKLTENLAFPNFKIYQIKTLYCFRIIPKKANFLSEDVLTKNLKTIMGEKIEKKNRTSRWKPVHKKKVLPWNDRGTTSNVVNPVQKR